jgi:hypothetical protein
MWGFFIEAFSELIRQWDPTLRVNLQSSRGILRTCRAQGLTVDTLPELRLAFFSGKMCAGQSARCTYRTAAGVLHAVVVRQTQHDHPENGNGDG